VRPGKTVGLPVVERNSWRHNFDQGTCDRA
jgi:hypothetical protein